MSKIVRRDFFPDIQKLETQLEFIEATESNDYEKLRLISERFASTNQTPAPGGKVHVTSFLFSSPFVYLSLFCLAATPSTFETPSTSASGPNLDRAKLKRSGGAQPAGDNLEASELKKARPEDGKRLDAFLSQYQSEDDASFGEIMEKAEEKRREKYAWLYESERDARIALEAPEERLAITDGGREKELKAIDQRPASVKTWTYTGKNTLMYFPEGVELSAKEKVEAAGKGKEVVHANTRLSREFLRKTALARAGTEGQGGMLGAAKDKVGVDGRVLLPGESPQVNGYGFVATPQIHPGVDASPLMTWGSIDGTPFHLETDITPMPGPSFKMPKVPRREEIAIKLTEKVSKAQRDRKKAAEQAASPALLRQKLGGATPSASERLQLLSPAARKLVSRAVTPGSIGGTDKALRASYTPTHTPLTPGSATPRQTKDTPGRDKPSGSAPSTPSLTDNLLNLSYR